MITLTWLFFSLVSLLYALNEEMMENSLKLQPSNVYCFLDFSATDPMVIACLITVIVFMFAPFVFMIIAYSQIILFYKEMNRKKKKTSAAVSLDASYLLII